MRSLLKFFLGSFLKCAAKLTLFLHRPRVIALAGSTNKSFVKDEVQAVLRNAPFSVRVTPRNFNTDVGLPLSILGLPSGYGDYRAWLPILSQSIRSVFHWPFPEVLVLEFGMSNRGDMRYLLSIVHPDIVVLTGVTQRYAEHFSDINAMMKEYGLLVRSMKRDGLLVFNGDSMRLRKIAESFPGKRVSFGLSLACDWQARDVKRVATGESFCVWHSGKLVEESRIDRFGEHHVFARLASMAVREHLSFLHREPVLIDKVAKKPVLF